MTQFQQVGVQPWLAKQCSYMALQTPTPIQQRCIPAILAGQHVVGGAVTGSGKTAAFALPILQTLAVDTYGVYALILTPSRELAYQIIDQFVAFGAPLQVRTMLAIGGVATEAQVDALKARPHIVAATPGRLRHLLETFGQETKKAFAHLRYLVLDEADRLTEGDIQCDVWALLRLLPPATAQRQVLMFTATLHPRLTSFANPGTTTPFTTDNNNISDGGDETVSVLAKLGITDPKTLAVIVVKGVIQENGGTATQDASSTAAADARDGDNAHNADTAGTSGRSLASSYSSAALPNTALHLPETLQQHYLFIPNMVKLPYLVAALRAQGKNQSTIVYVNSCLRAELVRLTLQLLGFPVCSLDSLLTQQHRLDNVASFKLGIARILICTDIAARGLDIPTVGLVLHYDVPKHAETYVHRVGRTARAGREGHSVALVTEYDVSLIQRIEKRTKSKLTLWKSPAAKESAILPLLDEVSSAKIQAKQQVTEQFSDRVQTNKAHAAFKRQARAQSQAAAMAQARQRRERYVTAPQQQTEQGKRRGEQKKDNDVKATPVEDCDEGVSATAGKAVMVPRVVKRTRSAAAEAGSTTAATSPLKKRKTTTESPAKSVSGASRKKSRRAAYLN